ncbi:UDP-2,3-diacylglucosamine diphosphatase [Pararhodobacter sp. CCB-MM2]|uniref:UDP-2,3-diacylglucosamine diphosphatase n=1 Tax=Pararhodobacter sp. CCB-MM2 TaxID=1786003 RepID=UPI0008313666|nr:UDP-2,3-diacylglucosamine diphosphatase [Pararhodobacter sp. CCB-MM2]
MSHRPNAAAVADHRPSPRACRSLFLSDLHLGALGSKSDRVLDFLKAHRAETYFLVGDVLDLWQPLLPHWTDEDQAVIDHLNQRQAEGATLVYLRGNHDPHPHRAPKAARPRVEAIDRLIHRAANGKRYLVIHGDCVDARLFRAHVFTRLGSRLDHALRSLDRVLQRLWRQSPGEARSWVEALLGSINTLMHAGRTHERKLVDLARAEGLDGVICGHFHLAGLHDELGLTYANCGDWVDSTSGIVEGFDGRLQLVFAPEPETATDTATAPLPAHGDLLEA